MWVIEAILNMKILQNPCDDPRHRNIIPPQLSCSNITLPNLLIVGPQKTGAAFHILQMVNGHI